MNETQETVSTESTVPAASESPMETESASSEAVSEVVEISEEEMDTICPPEAQEKREKWSSFVEGPAVDFFTGYKLEKMTIDDGNGNKAKFSRTKDSGIKIEYTSSVLL